MRLVSDVIFFMCCSSWVWMVVWVWVILVLVGGFLVRWLILVLISFLILFSDVLGWVMILMLNIELRDCEFCFICMFCVSCLLCISRL